MTVRKRVLSIRLSDDEYQSLKALADQAGTSVPVHARTRALESVQLAPRLDQIERRLRGVPDGAVMVSALEKLSVRLVALQRLAEKIDLATTAKKKEGVTP